MEYWTAPERPRARWLLVAGVGSWDGRRSVLANVSVDPILEVEAVRVDGGRRAE